MTDEELQAIRARAAAATPGPWGWFGYVPAPRGYGKQRNIYLATRNRGRIYIMDFQRWGFRDAAPRFQDHKHGLMINDPATAFEVAGHSGQIEGVRHPDAAFIAHARQDVDDLLAALDALKKAHAAEVAQLEDALNFYANGNQDGGKTAQDTLLRIDEEIDEDMERELALEWMGDR